MRFTDLQEVRTSVTQFARFLIAGALNSGVTYVLYLLLLRVLPYAVAYSLSFAAGIVLSLVLQGRWVFRTVITTRAVVQLPLVYGIQYLSGIGLLALFVERFRLPREVAPLLVVACTVPITFLLARYAFRARSLRA